MKKNESAATQIEIAKKFVEQLNQEKTGEVIDIVRCYTDLGKTGSNFEREGFSRLLQDIRRGEINCVIVKDLSRFGRNYLEAGNYIEKIFPFLGVRFIAVTDGFDTGKEGGGNQQMASEIKNLVNDMYAKEFSKKARLQLKQRREEGSYVGGPPPYGYRAEWKGKRRVLLPDRNTEAVVRFIYEKFVEKESYAAVADELNRRQINPPYLYKKTRKVCYSLEDCRVSADSGYKGWDRSAVERILKSETYAGTLVQGKTGITARNEKNRLHRPERDWIVTKEAQEPLISRELYQKTAEIREKIRKRSASHRHSAGGCPIEENIFDGVLYCGVCGRKMTRNSYVKQYEDGKKERIDGYFCLNGGRTKTAVCPDSNRISKKELLDILLPLVHMGAAVFLNQSGSDIEYGTERIPESIKKVEAEIRKTGRSLRDICEEESDTYIAYRSGKITQKEYAALKTKQADRLAELRKQQEEQQKEIGAWNKRSASYPAAVSGLFKIKNGKELTKDMIGAFISKISVYPGKRVEVIVSFAADGKER